MGLEPTTAWTTNAASNVLSAPGSSMISGAEPLFEASPGAVSLASLAGDSRPIVGHPTFDPTCGTGRIGPGISPETRAKAGELSGGRLARGLPRLGSRPSARPARPPRIGSLRSQTGSRREQGRIHGSLRDARVAGSWGVRSAGALTARQRAVRGCRRPGSAAGPGSLASKPNRGPVTVTGCLDWASPMRTGPASGGSGGH
jgi:hypothetical protein